MNEEIALISLARQLDRRTLLGRSMFAGFVTVGAFLTQVPKDVFAQSCSGCSACNGSWCSCSDCNGDGTCGDGKNCNFYNCAYPSGCWTISSGVMCCDCSGCDHSPSPCTCRPRGYGC